MNPLRTLDRSWLAPAPPERLATLRILIGGFGAVYLLARAPVLADFGDLAPARFEPVGATVLLGDPLPGAIVWMLWAAAVMAGVLFTVGYRFRISGPLFAALLLWVTSYRNSWGMVFHTDNLTVLHTLALGLCPAAAHALSVDAGRTRHGAPHGRYGWPIRLLSALTVIVYFIAGLSKLRISGLHWAEGEILRNYIAYDAVRKAALGSIHSPLGAWLCQWAWPFPVIGALTLALELGAPAALLHPRLGKAWVAGIYAFHVGVLVTMAIAFPYPLSGIAFASFFPAEAFWRWRPVERVVRALQRGPPPAR